MKYPLVKLPSTYTGSSYQPDTYIIKAKDYFYSDGFDEEVSDDYIIQEFMEEEIIPLVEYYMPDMKDVTLKTINFETLPVMDRMSEKGIILMKSSFGYLITSTDSEANAYMISLVPISIDDYDVLRTVEPKIRKYDYNQFIEYIFKKMEVKFQKTLRKRFPPYLYMNINNKLRKVE